MRAKNIKMNYYTRYGKWPKVKMDQALSIVIIFVYVNF